MRTMLILLTIFITLNFIAGDYLYSEVYSDTVCNDNMIADDSLWGDSLYWDDYMMDSSLCQIYDNIDEWINPWQDIPYPSVYMSYKYTDTIVIIGGKLELINDSTAIIISNNE